MGVQFWYPIPDKHWASITDIDSGTDTNTFYYSSPII